MPRWRDGGRQVSIDRKPSDVLEGEAHTLPATVVVTESGNVAQLEQIAPQLAEISAQLSELIQHMRLITGENFEGC